MLKVVDSAAHSTTRTKDEAEGGDGREEGGEKILFLWIF